ncbi:MAG TPA: acetyl-CoA hydrolase/transferase C-terminal domain-containing protein [Polyangiales bacterium]
MQTLPTPEAAVDAVIARVGKKILLCAPLALGKPNHLINAFYRRAKADPSIELSIHTALTLERPSGSSDLEKRFLGPMVQRVFGNYPDLDYERDRMAGRLPANVRVIEFYFPAGKYLNVQSAQRDYTSTNYTHVARDLLARGVNVIVQQVVAGVVAGRPRLSLSSNPDVILDMEVRLRADERTGRAVAIVAQLNDQLPFMFGDANVAPELFDFVVDDPQGSYTLFGPPKTAVSDADYMIGLYGSALVKDGGELQVGIGALGDAVVYALKLRHEQNEQYQRALTRLAVGYRFPTELALIGETQPLQQGLFAATEMLVDGFMHLFEAGILKRKVYDDVVLSRLLNEGRITEQVTAELLDLLRARRAIHSVLTQEDLAYLQHFGILREELRWQGDHVVLPDGRAFVADLSDPSARSMLQAWLGTTLEHGAVIHAGFFLGPQAFYDWLRKLPEEKRRLIDMRSVTRINQLYGHEEIDRLHRRNARFINTTMMVTLLGAAVSDALEDGRVVSGVGGQYNFVAMAHELPGGRSILQLRSTRMEHGELRSSLVWSYGHVTIPRHLRDVVITEYGIADLRGKTDEECVIALLDITDSRFQDELLQQAKRHGKLRAGYTIADKHRRNFPDSYARALRELRAPGLFPAFPFGTDLTPDEIRLGRALRLLKAKLGSKAGLAQAIASAATHGTPASDVESLLRRMDLHAPSTLKERLYQRLLTAALRGK